MTSEELADTIAKIRVHHRSARFAMKQQMRIDRSLEAFICFNVLGYSNGEGEKERKAKFAEARKLIASVHKTNEPHWMIDDAVSPLIKATLASRQPFDALRDEHESAIETLAKTLPIWRAWGANVRGFGALGLGQIVGESGDLAGYATVSKLWKRLGLAVMDGKRQGAAGEGATAETWIAHGYNAQRRSIVWNIGQSLFKHQSQKVDDETGEALREAGIYRQIYDARKIYETPRVASKGHAHNRATRYMEKMFVADLWSEWRRARGLSMPGSSMLAAE